MPLQFQTAYPELVKNLRVNSHRLTTPYDLHITLRHILNLSAFKKIPTKAIGCRNCRSLFHEISLVRSCGDVNIPDDSCPCSLEIIKVSKRVIKFAAQHAVDALNQKLKSMKAENGEACAVLKLQNIILAQSQLMSPWNLNYLITFNVSPSNAQFEALMERKFESILTYAPRFKLLQEIFHINKDHEPIFCVPKSQLSGNITKRVVVNDEDLEL